MSTADELRSLRLDVGVSPKEIVETVQELYPKYDRAALTKCERGNEYGVTLQPDALAALYKKYAPQGTATSRRRKDRHRLTDRIYCRLEKEAYSALQRQMQADGYATVQQLIADLVRQYLEKGDLNGKYPG